VIDASELRASLVTLGHPDPSPAEVALSIAQIDQDGRQAGGSRAEDWEERWTRN